MLLHAPAMSAHGQAPSIQAASALHSEHRGSGPLELADDEQCCAICTPAGCGLAPVPETVLPLLAELVEPVRWPAGASIASSASDHHWPAPRGPPLPG